MDFVQKGFDPNFVWKEGTSNRFRAETISSKRMFGSEETTRRIGLSSSNHFSLRSKKRSYPARRLFIQTKFGWGSRAV